MIPLLLALGVAVVQSPPNLDLSTSAFAAHYGYLRHLQSEASVPADFATAVETMSKVGRSFPSKYRSRTGAMIEDKDKAQALYWQSLDALVFGSGSDRDLADLPKLMPTIGGDLATSSAVEAIRAALNESRRAFSETVWPAEEISCRRRIAEFGAIPREKLGRAFEFILRLAALEQSPKRLSILVVDWTGGKEGMTVRTPTGLLVLIGAQKYTGFDFAEVVVHEATHVLDRLNGKTGLFSELRAALVQAKRTAAEVEQASHLMIFMLAAEAVRRELDPLHQDVGKTGGAYSRGLEGLRLAILPDFEKLVDDRLSREGFVRLVVSKLPKTASIEGPTTSE